MTHDADIRVGDQWRPRGRHRWRWVHVIGSPTRQGERVFVVRRVPERPGERSAVMPAGRLERYYTFARRSGQQRIDWDGVAYDDATRFVAALGLDPREMGL